MSLPRFDYRAPRTVGEAIALRQEFGDDALLMAGGLATVILLRERMISPRVVVSSSGDSGTSPRRDEQRALDRRDGDTQRGRALSGDPEVAPLLAKRRVGSPAIRNMGTLGGNLSHGDAASDPAPALLALDAEAIIAGPGQERRMPLRQFFRSTLTTALADDELLVAARCRRRRPAPVAVSSSTLRRRRKPSRPSPWLCRSCWTVPEPAHMRVSGWAASPLSRFAPSLPKICCGAGSCRPKLSPIPAPPPQSDRLVVQRSGLAEYRREMTGVWVRRRRESLAE